MKILLLAALVATVTSSRFSADSDPEIRRQWPWEQGKLYRYDVESKTLAYLQEGSSTGYAFKARFIVRVKTPSLLEARLEDPQHAQVHEELWSDKRLPEDLKYQPVKDLDKLFEITLEGGRVLSLNLPVSLSTAHENLIKGLLSALQVDLSTHRNVDWSPNHYDKEIQQGQFSKMETDVTGDCETLYTISPVAAEWRRELPWFVHSEDPIEITKSKSYGHCHHRVAYHFGVPEGAEWTGTAHKTKEDQLMKRFTNSRILVGKQGPIFKAETTSTVHVHPHLSGKQSAEVLSYVKFTLVSYDEDREADWEKPEEYRHVQRLLYTMNSKRMPTELASEKPQSRQQRSTSRLVRNKNHKHITDDSNPDNSDSQDSNSAYVNEDVPDSSEPAYNNLYAEQNPMKIQKMVQELAQMLQNTNNMPKGDFLSKFDMLVYLIESLTYEQLTLTSRAIEVAQSSTNVVKADMWMIYRDAVARAGNLPALKQIHFWIQKKKLQGEEAAEVISSIANSLKYPTKEAMTQFFKLAMSPEVSEQQYLNSTALIAATRLINMGQVNNETAHSYYPTHMYGRLSHKKDKFVLNEILPRLQKSLEQAIQEGDSRKAQVYVKAIGNLGHRSILEVFSPYLEGKVQVSTYLRALMVDNLQVLARQGDRYVRAVLYSILRNTAEPYEVRVAAIQNIFLAQPTTTMMQAMAQMTHDDPSVHVRAALKSSIESAAELKQPRYWEVSRTAQAARSLLTKEKLSQHYSTKKYDDYFDSDYKLGIMKVVSYIGSEDSVLPKFLKYSEKKNSFGWNSISASFSSVQKFFDYAKQQMHPQQREQQPSWTQSNHKYSPNKISEMLNIKPDPENPLEGALYFNFMNQQRFFAFNEDDLIELPHIMKQYISKLPKGIEKHYTKVLNQAQVNIVFPVASGMPFIFKYKEPTVIHMQSKVKGEVKFPSQEQRDYSGSIDKEIQITYARNIDGSVGFMDTLGDRVATVGVINKIQVNIPVKVQLQIQSGEMKIRLQPLRPDQDTTILHYSVWPYSANQKKDSSIVISQDPATKVITRKNKVSAIDTKFGQSIGTQFHLQGYSYSSDYKSLDSMFQSPNLWSNIASAVYQKDVAMTHYNLRYLGKPSQTKSVTFTAVYDKYYNQKENTQEPLAASDTKDITPNSETRRQEMVKRVSSAINTAKAHIIDLSAEFEGPQKLQYVLTAALGTSPVDSKIQYAFFAGRNSQQGNSQINGVGTVRKPEIVSLNFLEALKKNMKMVFESDIKFGQNNNGNIKIQGFTDRSKKYAEALMDHHTAKHCAQEISRNDYYQEACHNMIVMAHAPDYLKASITYKDVSPTVKYMLYRAYRIAEYYRFWYADVNPMKTTADGKLDIEMQADYLEKYLNLILNSRYGEVRMKNVPIPKVTAGVVSTYSHFSPTERVLNYYSQHQYQPYCTVDGSRIKSFSNRAYEYILSRSWHVVMLDAPRRPEDKLWAKERLVVLARKPNQDQQEIYISYTSATGTNLEIEIQPARQGSIKHGIKVNTNSKKVSDGELTMYWDDQEQVPLLEYYTQPDGVLMLKIREDRLRTMYDGQRLVVSTSENRNKTRGLCGYMSGEPRDDYLTPQGLVDQPKHYGALYALIEDDSEPMLQQYQTEAQQSAYQPNQQYTAILRSDDEWQKVEDDSSSSEEDYRTERVYQSMSYSKQDGPCQLQHQVQFYENHAEICITTHVVESCQSHCKGQGYQTRPVQVVCRPKMDEEFKLHRHEIQQGQDPQVDGVQYLRQFRVPTSCVA